MGELVVLVILVQLCLSVVLFVFIGLHEVHDRTGLALVSSAFTLKRSIPWPTCWQWTVHWARNTGAGLMLLMDASPCLPKAVQVATNGSQKYSTDVLDDVDRAWQEVASALHEQSQNLGGQSSPVEGDLQARTRAHWELSQKTHIEDQVEEILLQDPSFVALVTIGLSKQPHRLIFTLNRGLETFHDQFRMTVTPTDYSYISRFFLDRAVRTRVITRLVEGLLPSDPSSQVLLKSLQKTLADEQRVQGGAINSNGSVDLAVVDQKTADPVEYLKFVKIRSLDAASFFKTIKENLTARILFANLLVGIGLDMLPTQMQKIVTDLPLDCTWVRYHDNFSIGQKARKTLEELTGTTWIWSPFLPHLEQLPPEETRLVFRCVSAASESICPVTDSGDRFVARQLSKKFARYRPNY